MRRFFVSETQADAAAHIIGKAAVVDAIKARVEVRGGKLVMREGRS